MVTTVMIVGEISEVIMNNVRYLLVERSYRNYDGQFIVDKIPCQHWAKATNNYFMTIKNGTLVCVRGRLETIPDLGIGIIADYLETLIPVRLEK